MRRVPRFLHVLSLYGAVSVLPVVLYVAASILAHTSGFQLAVAVGLLALILVLTVTTGMFLPGSAVWALATWTAFWGGSGLIDALDLAVGINWSGCRMPPGTDCDIVPVVISPNVMIGLATYLVSLLSVAAGRRLRARFLTRPARN